MFIFKAFYSFSKLFLWLYDTSLLLKFVPAVLYLFYKIPIEEAIANNAPATCVIVMIVNNFATDLTFLLLSTLGVDRGMFICSVCSGILV